MRRTVVAAVVVIVALAGCGGVGSDAPGSPAGVEGRTATAGYTVTLADCSGGDPTADAPATNGSAADPTTPTGATHTAGATDTTLAGADSTAGGRSDGRRG